MGKVSDQTPNRHVSGESDDLIVPEKQANNAGPPAAESVEGRGSTKGNVARQDTDRTQSRKPVSFGLGGIRSAADRDTLCRPTWTRHSPKVRAV